MAQRALSTSWRVRIADGPEGERLARLALQVLDATDVARYGRRTIDDFRARAWAYLGNVRRSMVQDVRAAEALGQAMRLVEGSPDPAEQALVRSLLSSLRIDQRRFGEAQTSIRDAERLYRSIQDDPSIGGLLVTEGRLFSEAGEPQKASQILKQAVTAIDPLADTRSAFCARHALAIAYLDSGDLAAARRASQEAERFHHRFPERPVQLKIHWLEGILASACGHRERAESLLQSVCAAYTLSGIPYLAALVALDLADHYARTDQAQELRNTAHGAAGIFFALGHASEAMAALALREGRPRRAAPGVRRV